MDFLNPCGGTRWRTLPDGRIEVEGRGAIEPPEAFGADVLRSWQNFAPEIRAASKKRGVPLAWIAALISVETGLWSQSRTKQASQSSGCCVGPMAVMVTPSPNYRIGGYTSPDEMWDPAKNIDTGAAIIANLAKKGYGLPAIAAAYNSGGTCCPNSPAVPSKPGGRQANEFNLCSASPGGHSYPELAIMANNFLITRGIVSSGTSLAGMLGMTLLGGAIVVGGAMALGYVKPIWR